MPTPQPLPEPVDAVPQVPPPTRASRRRSRSRFSLRRQGDRSTLVAVVAAILLALVIVSPSFGGHPPADPALVASDGRFALCNGTIADAEYAFEIPIARDYQYYLPQMSVSPDLNLGDPAFIVIFRGLNPSDAGGFTGRNGQPTPTRVPTAGLHDVCIYVGADARGGSVNYFDDVSIQGLRVQANGSIIEPDSE
jgi:hypothetical protein